MSAEGVSRRILAVVLVSLAGCAAPSARVSEQRDNPASIEENRVANLKRAAQYPWTDDGACAVKAAAGEWKMLVEKCYYALDVSRIQFRDLEHRCPLAQTDAAAVGPLVGLCLLAQPEIAVGAVVVIGVVVVAMAIAAELSKYCNCFCLDHGFFGIRWRGPYPIGLKESEYVCSDACSSRGYNTGYCR